MSLSSLRACFAQRRSWSSCCVEDSNPDRPAAPICDARAAAAAFCLSALGARCFPTPAWPDLPPPAGLRSCAWCGFAPPFLCLPVCLRLSCILTNTKQFGAGYGGGRLGMVRRGQVDNLHVVSGQLARSFSLHPCRLRKHWPIRQAAVYCLQVQPSAEISVSYPHLSCVSSVPACTLLPSTNQDLFSLSGTWLTACFNCLWKPRDTTLPRAQDAGSCGCGWSWDHRSFNKQELGFERL